MIPGTRSATSSISFHCFWSRFGSSPPATRTAGEWSVMAM